MKGGDLSLILLWIVFSKRKQVVVSSSSIIATKRILFVFRQNKETEGFEMSCGAALSRLKGFSLEAEVFLFFPLKLETREAS